MGEGSGPLRPASRCRHVAGAACRPVIVDANGRATIRNRTPAYRLALRCLHAGDGSSAVRRGSPLPLYFAETASPHDRVEPWAGRPATHTPYAVLKNADQQAHHAHAGETDQDRRI